MKSVNVASKDVRLQSKLLYIQTRDVHYTVDVTVTYLAFSNFEGK